MLPPSTAHCIYDHSPSQTSPLAKRRILLIDPERDAREVMQTCLELTTDWQVMAVDNYRDGLEIAENQLVQAILVSIERLNWEAQLVLAALQNRAARCGVPTLAIAERVHYSESQAARAIGLAGCISPLSDGVSLGEQIAHCLGWLD
ncbi:MAG: hypothetical protein HC910_03895 [Spirulinaceae cyanobacterium SM2_1_0]|nr:hypothetical protein [Spirulinaceae cyanobacterium SM2_1_0]